jgi:hypothetical protein
MKGLMMSQTSEERERYQAQCYFSDSLHRAYHKGLEEGKRRGMLTQFEQLIRFKFGSAGEELMTSVRNLHYFENSKRPSTPASAHKPRRSCNQHSPGSLRRNCDHLMMGLMMVINQTPEEHDATK